MPHIIVLGAGSGEITAALDIRSQLRSEDQVKVVNKMDRHTFIPSNPWAVGRRNPEKFQVPLADMFEKRPWAVWVGGREKQLDLVLDFMRRHRPRAWLILDFIHVRGSCSKASLPAIEQ